MRLATRPTRLLIPAVCTALCALSLASAPALAAGDANEASCPNEAFVGFEPYLADCRAYERVTPPFKAGSPTNLRAVSNDGARVVSESTGLFAGSEGGRLSAFYASARSATGWRTAALDPPSALFPAQELLDVSEDLTGSLWQARRPSESLSAEDLVLRKTIGASVQFVGVGPMLPPEVTNGVAAEEAQQFLEESDVHYVGASQDLSEVLFQLDGFRWPGDTTEARQATTSLYEYVGTGNTSPRLVGIDGEARVISACGATFGSFSGEPGADVYNALSADGETVFFTTLGLQQEPECQVAPMPEVAELYARVGNGAAAHTVAVSEPSAEQCAVCDVPATVAEGRASAAFQGASRDGSRVFFLTKQELFKGDTGTNLYEYDFTGPPGHRITRVSLGSANPEVQGVARVSEDGSHVYFVAQGVLTEGPNAEEHKPVASSDNLYVFERDAAHPAGHLAFIATLSPTDSGSFQGDWSLRDQRPVQTTPDGRYVVFQSVADLTSGDVSTVPQVFEYDALREELVRVSVAEPGYAPGTAAAEEYGGRIPVQKYVRILRPSQGSTSLAVSADGAVVEFQSAGGLTAQARAAGEAHTSSVFEYRSVGTLSDGRVFSVSNGNSLFGALARGTDATGSDAFFETVAPVLPSDDDNQVDIYDARTDGGFPAAGTRDCETNLTCQGGLSVAPVFGGSGSESAPAGGDVRLSAPSPAVTPTRNVTSRIVKCKRGFVRRKHRCVKVKTANRPHHLKGRA